MRLLSLMSIPSVPRFGLRTAIRLGILQSFGWLSLRWRLLICKTIWQMPKLMSSELDKICARVLSLRENSPADMRSSNLFFHKVLHQLCAGEQRGGRGVLQQICREGPNGEVGDCQKGTICVHIVHRSGPDIAGVESKVCLPRRMGDRSAVRTRAVPRGEAFSEARVRVQLPSRYQGTWSSRTMRLVSRS
mmetsp:Transcript_24773/g.97927  ORF Transcript_24773/g.97927 Transcript_24773/m.97927 type:complete len:190 (+) Transcript_24773:937-1506(+)